MKRLSLIFGVLTAIVALAVGPSGAAGASRSATGASTVVIASSKLGRILVDAHGRTLYLFEKDRRGRSACYGACAAYWLPLVTSGRPTAGRGVEPPLLGVTRRSDGRSQVTYAGHPLYRFLPDTKPGQTTGQGLDQFGAEWYVVSPTGRKIEGDGS